MHSLEEFLRTPIGPNLFVMQRNIVSACDVVLDSSFFCAENVSHFGFTEEQLVACVPPRDSIVMARFRDGGLECALDQCGRNGNQYYVLVQTLIGDDGYVDEATVERLPDNVIAIFSKNVHVRHSRVFPMPIGLDWRAVEEGLSREYRRASLKPTVYVNLSVETGPMRLAVVAHFQEADLATTRVSVQHGRNALPYLGYLEEMATHGFCASPEGMALDQYRTWDALYCKTIPLIERNTHTCHWDRLPVIFVDDWHSVNDDFIRACIEDLEGLAFDLRPLTAAYWRTQIRNALDLG